MTGENSATNAATTVAAFAVERALGGARGSVAGLAVQPVVWAITGTGPDAADAFIYGTGAVGAVVGAIVAVPAIITGAVKAAVDDHTASLVAEARRDEPAAVRAGVTSVADYSFAASGGHIQAMTIASYGGVAWQHPNGVYLFLRDAAENPVCDYVPQRFTSIYRPLIPLQGNGDGRVRWTGSRP
ncbi:hypothetical protein [Oceaniglobus trochenteri]|uniref:hypothetical protein n=1 Tax=Oceaniglobus trochenteri TaxID=2763260 RepID=UPI001CFFE775|nr:hypothetical protein [Oceaniglobus trochenteri]